MNQLRKIDPPHFEWRTVDCDECNGTGRRCSDYYDRGSECFDCSGSGEWTAVCSDCGEKRPLNDDGECANCAQLTVVNGDPFLGRAA